MPLMNKIPKKIWEDEFKEWMESPMVRMALKGLIPEGRNDDLIAVLETAFETGFTHGVTGTLGAMVQRSERRGEGIEVNGIPQPELGQA